MSYYGYDQSSRHLAHKGKKGSKWGFTNGKRNGKRTAKYDDGGYNVGDGRKYKSKHYVMTKDTNDVDVYKRGDRTLTVKQEKRIFNKETTDAKGNITLQEGALTRGKRKIGKTVVPAINKASKSAAKSAKKISKSAKVKSKEVAAKAEKGKKKVMKWLEKKGLYTKEASVSNKVVTVSAPKSKKKKKK